MSFARRINPDTNNYSLISNTSGNLSLDVMEIVALVQRAIQQLRRATNDIVVFVCLCFFYNCFSVTLVVIDKGRFYLFRSASIKFELRKIVQPMFSVCYNDSMKLLLIPMIKRLEVR